MNFLRRLMSGRYERLAAIKARVDPENVFLHNANIEPALPLGTPS